MEITSVWQAVQAIGFMLIVSGIWFWAGMQYARNQDIKAFTKILSKMIEDRRTGQEAAEADGGEVAMTIGPGAALLMMEQGIRNSSCHMCGGWRMVALIVGITVLGVGLAMLYIYGEEKGWWKEYL